MWASAHFFLEKQELLKAYEFCSHGKELPFFKAE